MSQAELKYFEKKLIFKQPVKTASLSFKEKISIFVEMKSGSDIVSYGEVPILPEFGTETSQQAIEALNGELEMDYSSTPAVRFALDQIFLGEMREDISKFRKYVVPNFESIELQGFIGGGRIESDFRTAESLKAQGYKCVKIKVGRNINEELARIRQLAGILGYEVKLRIDPNGQWHAEDLAANEKSFNELNIDYIEQPVSSRKELFTLSSSNGIPLAADESVRTIDDLKILAANSKVKYVVIKPAICGGFFNSLEMIHLCEKHGITPIISSSYESNLGKEILILLASLTKSPSAHGLGNGSWFENDIVTNFFRQENNTIRFDLSKFNSVIF